MFKKSLSTGLVFLTLISLQGQITEQNFIGEGDSELETRVNVLGPFLGVFFIMN